MDGVSEPEPGKGGMCEWKGIWVKWEGTCVAAGVGTEIGDWFHTGIDPINKYIKDHGNYTVFTISQGVTMEREETGMEPMAGWKYQCEVMVLNMDG